MRRAEAIVGEKSGLAGMDGAGRNPELAQSLGEQRGRESLAERQQLITLLGTERSVVRAPFERRELPLLDQLGDRSDAESGGGGEGLVALDHALRQLRPGGGITRQLD